MIRGSTGTSSGAVFNSGDITTSGTNGRGIYVFTTGTISITNTGTVTTTGSNAFGLYGQAASGNSNITIDNSGTVRTTGTSAVGIQASTNNGTFQFLQTGIVDASGTGIFSNAINSTMQNQGTIAGAVGIATSRNTTLINDGAITGKAGAGYQISGGSVDVTNALGASITGSTVAISSQNTTQIDILNAGILAGGNTNSTDAGILATAGTLVITNEASGQISGSIGVSAQNTDLSLTNHGTLNGTLTGVVGTGGSTINNDGMIEGQNGIDLSGSGDSIVYNIGIGTVHGTSGTGIQLRSTSIIINDVDAAVKGAVAGIDSTGIDTLTQIDNYGRIDAGIGSAVKIHGNSMVLNQAGGVMSGAGGVAFGPDTSHSITNAGTIIGTATALDESNGSPSFGAGTGVYIAGSPNSAIANLKGGIIMGGAYAIYHGTSAAVPDASHVTIDNAGIISGATGIAASSGSLDVTNSGTITGTDGIAIGFNQIGTTVNSLALTTGSMLNGRVLGGAGQDSLILQGSNTEDLNKFTGFEILAMRGSEWTLNGASAFATSAAFDSGTLYLNGRLAVPTATISPDAMVAGFGTIVGNLANAGALAPGNAVKDTGMFGSFTVDGNYSSAGGTFILNTRLNEGGSASETDKIVVTGATSGAGSLKINNTNGAGALTVADGIQVIQVDGASDATFTLLGDYVHESAQAVVGGAYAYKLYHNGISDPADGDWYLRSVLKDPTEPPVEPPVCTPGVDCPVEPPVDPVTPPEPPLYQAGTPVYEAYPQLLLGLNGLPTLQQRVGNRYWNNGGNRIIAEGADAIGSPYAPSQEAGSFIEQNGVWGRIEGAHNRIDPRFSTTNAGYDFNTYKIQAGLDGMLAESEAGKLIGGVSVHYARGSANIRSVYDADNGGGDIRTDGYGIGGTLTWYGESGFYVDTQAQATWYDSDLGFDGGNATLSDGNHGFGYALSMESGKRITLDPAWSLTPQAQLVWSSVDFDDFSDVFGAAVRLDRGRSLQGRLGLALDHQTSWYNANGLIDRTQFYGVANLYYEFLEGTKVSVAGTGFANDSERLWGGIGLGGSYNWNSDKYAIYGEGSINTSLAQFADSYSIKGTMGFRVKW
ncbi:autotransporter outer membrane beta-barrel domain-containing protein [Brucella anthropi]|nr:autotransporter outer membrane beta-barrel domain-containing protein [Brucella anthropi]